MMGSFVICGCCCVDVDYVAANKEQAASGGGGTKSNDDRATAMEVAAPPRSVASARKRKASSSEVVYGQRRIERGGESVVSFAENVRPASYGGMSAAEAGAGAALELDENRMEICDYDEDDLLLTVMLARKRKLESVQVQGSVKDDDDDDDELRKLLATPSENRRRRPRFYLDELQRDNHSCSMPSLIALPVRQFLLLSFACCLFVGDCRAGLTQPEVPSQQEEEARAAGHWSLPNRPSLFSIVRFPNEECFDSSNQSGTCYTAFECKLLGGQPSSPCAAGFGSCCIVSRTCHVTTREKVVYFKNPSYPSTDSDEKVCDLTVEMSDINVCQVRLDFLDFQLDAPTNGACQQDYMEISASGMPPQTVPRLCGLNRNQHLYITVPQDLSERSASIVFWTDAVGDHRWQVKVTQIDCNHYKPIDWKRSYGKLATSPLWNPHPNGGMKLPMHLMGKYSTTFASGFQTINQAASALAYEFLKPQFTPRAPMGCLQYFTQPSGIIESFNFGHYLNNMDYSICLQRQPDTCRVVFTSSDYDWSLNGVGVSGSSSGVGDQDCARDYLLIPGASRTGDGFTYDRYCGGRLHYYRGQSLSAPVVIKTAGPIVLRFHSDGHYEGLNNGGFRLQYDQSTQDCIYHTAEESGSLSSQQLLASTLSDSRPLGGGSLMSEPPVLYSSQQLSSSSSSNNELAFEMNNKPQLSKLKSAQQQAVEQQMSDIKRYDLVGGEQTALLDNNTFDQPQRQPASSSNLNRLLQDLSKAFQLITTARSSS